CQNYYFQGDLPSIDERLLSSDIIIQSENPQPGMRKLTIGNEPEQQPRGLTAGQNLNQSGAISGTGFHHLPPIPCQ
ncbi:TPA: hypothetical protein ACIYL2_004805, partial [Escherichia coli]